MTVPPGHSRKPFVQWTGASAGVALVLFLGCAAAGAQVRDVEPVTDAMLQNPTPPTG